MPHDETKSSIWTYQDINGTNTTIIGVDNSYKIGDSDFKLTTFTGIGIDTNKDSSSSSVIVDVKGNYRYGDTCLSGGFRLRNKFGENTQSTQLRLQPMNVNIPVSDKVSLYATPYVVGKQNWKNNTIEPVVGGFAGASYKVRAGKMSIEGQYDRSITRGTNGYSVNVGYVIPLQNL